MIFLDSSKTSGNWFMYWLRHLRYSSGALVVKYLLKILWRLLRFSLQLPERMAEKAFCRQLCTKQLDIILSSALPSSILASSLTLLDLIIFLKFECQNSTRRTESHLLSNQNNDHNLELLLLFKIDILVSNVLIWD